MRVLHDTLRRSLRSRDQLPLLLRSCTGSSRSSLRRAFCDERLPASGDGVSSCGGDGDGDGLPVAPCMLAVSRPHAPAHGLLLRSFPVWCWPSCLLLFSSLLACLFWRSRDFFLNLFAVFSFGSLSAFGQPENER